MIWIVYLSFRKFKLLYPSPSLSLRAAAGGEAIPISARRLLRYARNERRQRVFHGFRATRCEFPERMIQYRDLNRPTVHFETLV
jgi:hypothetical protein